MFLNNLLHAEQYRFLIAAFVFVVDFAVAFDASLAWKMKLILIH